MLRRLDETTLVSGQIRPGEIAGLAKEHGLTMLINNRPDGEDEDQPLAAEVQAAAEAAGIAYRHVPIIRGIGPADVEAMHEALREANGPVLAFCRSGTRSALAWAVAMRDSGRSREEIEAKVEAAGFNVAPIAHLL